MVFTFCGILQKDHITFCGIFKGVIVTICCVFKGSIRAGAPATGDRFSAAPGEAFPAIRPVDSIDAIDKVDEVGLFPP